MLTFMEDFSRTHQFTIAMVAALGTLLAAFATTGAVVVSVPRAPWRERPLEGIAKRRNLHDESHYSRCSHYNHEYRNA